MRIIMIRSGVVSVLFGAAVCGQAQTPPAQPAYPASPQIEQNRANANRVTPQRNVNPQIQTSDSEPRCDRLSGLEKSECERRDVANDAAPAGVTTSMHEKKQRVRADADNEAPAAASEAEADSDTARRPSQSATPMRQAARDRTKPDEDSDDEAARNEGAQNDATNRREQASESESDADTLSPPRR